MEEAGPECQRLEAGLAAAPFGGVAPVTAFYVGCRFTLRGRAFVSALS
jgi:hypothetical protein